MEKIELDDVREWLRVRRLELKDRARSTWPHQFVVSKAMKDALIEYIAMTDYPVDANDLIIVHGEGGLSYQGIPIVVDGDTGHA